MNEEEKAAAEEVAKAEAEAKAKAEAEKGQSIDYKLELEKEQERLKKAEAVIEQERARRIAAEQANRDGEESPVPTADEFRKIAREEALRASGSALAETLVARLASNEDEKKLILHHYKNSIIPTGDVEEDVEAAYALANRKRLKLELEEAKRAIASRENRGQGSGEAGKPDVAKPIVELTPGQEKILSKVPAKFRDSLRKKYLAQNEEALKNR